VDGGGRGSSVETLSVAISAINYDTPDDDSCRSDDAQSGEKFAELIDANVGYRDHGRARRGSAGGKMIPFSGGVAGAFHARKQPYP